ncbi:MAG: hypothetical protein ACE5MI_01095 [Acidimicrobiia bacterium]
MTIVQIAMAANEDPKPGRWILPIIIVGMIGFTYFFVQTLEASDSTTPTTVAGATTTTAPVAPPTTQPSAPTTTSPPSSGAEAYIAEVTTKQTEAEALEVRLVTANQDWEDRATTGVSFSETEAAFSELQADTNAFADSVLNMPGPPAGSPGAAEEHANMIAAAGSMETAAVAVLDGLRAPDDGSLRRAAVDDYINAVDQFLGAGDAAMAALG